MPALYLGQAIVQLLEETNPPVVTEYSLYALVRPILESGSYKGRPITRMPTHWGHSQLRAMIYTLMKKRTLAPDEDFKTGVWQFVQSLTAASAEQAICLVDPFAYISHLSAMQRYGFTDRAPEALHMTTPARALWTQMRTQRMAEDYSEASVIERPPPLIRIGLQSVIRRRPISLHETKHPARPTDIADNSSRIANVGRVFVDMLDEPALCGGIQHVLQTFERHAEDWVEEIAGAVDAFDSPIIYVRAGYIFDELLDIRIPQVERWHGFAQRGGSRKLDPHAEYGSRFSAKWMMALNV
ncbi:MAG TPA: hypothetical protein VK533_11160 [Sphingomonas sp.]|uniref:type IV toxin-antitoxin system AbiEi family antitoxin domain-containing protein n=1 Tax=Sphingomonas sp. TaxID=28214 RepID=UPI002C81D45C|nr:hypothetical protein [Sphingomonas sp.]HMI20093.1 hypothetical protein [Sphingomonas sp.]